MYMRKLKIAAGVVLFNPENIDRLKILLNKLEQQFDKVYIFNNGDDISLSINFNKIHYITKKENMGIAFALNTIMEYAKNDGYSWVVSMDQDSLIPDGLIDGFVSAIKTYEKIGIVCPQVVDKRRIFSDIKKNKNHEFVDFCITSASCTSIEAWEMCGKYDEWMFIDLVDNDFCKRLTITGYKILQLNEWVLDQEFGKIVPKNKKKQIFWFKISKRHCKLTFCNAFFIEGYPIILLLISCAAFFAACDIFLAEFFTALLVDGLLIAPVAMAETTAPATMPAIPVIIGVILILISSSVFLKSTELTSK